MKNRANDLLAKILNTVEGSDMILQGMKSDVSPLSTTVVSHSSSIKTLEEKINQLTTLVYPNSYECEASHTKVNPEDWIKSKL